MCIWTPELIVSLIKVSAWPLVVLLLGLRFRARLSESIQGFFNRNSISKLSAGSTGISAEFVASKQTSEAKESQGKSPISLPDHVSATVIQERQESNKTELSEELYGSIKLHVAALDIPPEQQIDLLCKELSLMQSTIRYLEINKVLFRSQFNLFSVMANNDGHMAAADIQRHFASVKAAVDDGLSDWDWIKYLAFPSGSGILSSSGDGYSLTVVGKSYVEFMSRNPQLIDDLAKL